MHLGLIGGIGSAATVVYYQRLTEKMRQRNSRLELTIVQADVYDLLKNNLANPDWPQYIAIAILVLLGLGYVVAEISWNLRTSLRPCVH